MLTWSDLSNEEKRAMSDGCGSKGFWVPIPNFMFKASCDQHDFYFWRGGSGSLRKKVDKEFLSAMLDDAGSKYRYKLWAYLYYYGVRFGAFLDMFKKPEDKFWHYTDKPRGRRELNAYLKRKLVK